MEIILLSLVLFGLAYYVYRTYSINRLLLSSVPLIAGAAYFIYGIYLRAVSPYLRPLASLFNLVFYTLILSILSIALLKEHAQRIYAISISSLIALYLYPNPVLLTPSSIFYSTIILSIFVLVSTYILRRILRPSPDYYEEDTKKRVYVIVLFFIPILGRILASFGSFKAAVLSNVLSLDVAATVIYGTLYTLLLGITLLKVIRIGDRYRVILTDKEFLERVSKIALVSFVTFALLFIYPPSALAMILLLATKVKIPKKRAAVVIFSALIGAALLIPNVGAQHYDINVQARNDYPITIDHLRLIDRPLFIDIVTTSVRLNVSDVTASLVTEAANVGIVNGKPLYIVPFVVKRYSEGNNKMLGYISLPLDRPVPEAANVKYVEMKVAPGLLGLKDLENYVNSIYGPKGYKVTEYYLIDDSQYASRFGLKNPFRVVLLEHRKYRSYPEAASFVVLVDKDGNVREASPNDLPQGVSSYTIYEMLKIRGENQRDRSVDYTASGALRIPPSATLLESLEGDFYARFHHVVTGNSRVRDAYFLVKTANYESAVAAVINRTSITLYDLRGYSFGGSRGVVVPDRALDAFSQLLSSQGVFNVDVRYPKLYRYGSHLLRISLVIEERPDADRVRGVVFAEAANTRISGFVEYSYGESLSVFLERLKEAIDATYAGYSGGSQTQTAYVNGTVLRVGSFLTQYQDQIVQVFVFYVQNDTDVVIFLVHPAYVASLQEYYKASLVKPGDEIYAGLRYVIELQSRCAYSVDILSRFFF